MDLLDWLDNVANDDQLWVHLLSREVSLHSYNTKKFGSKGGPAWFVFVNLWATESLEDPLRSGWQRLVASRKDQPFVTEQYLEEHQLLDIWRQA